MKKFNKRYAKKPSWELTVLPSQQTNVEDAEFPFTKGGRGVSYQLGSSMKQWEFHR